MSEHIEESLEDPEFRAEYERLEGSADRDFLDELLDERTAQSPDFPVLVEGKVESSNTFRSRLTLGT